MAIDNADLTEIKNLPSVGTPSSLIHFAVQYPLAIGIAQQITQAELSQDSEMITPTEQNNQNYWLTGKAFTDTTANTARFGTIKVADTAAVAAKTSITEALVPDNVDDIGDTLFTPTNILASNIDPVKIPTSSTIANFTMYEILVGNLKIINGYLDFTPSANSTYIEFTLNNTSSPLISQAGSANWYVSTTTDRIPIGMTVVSGGTNIVKIRFGIQFGATFVSGDTYRIHLSASYITS